MSRAIYAAELLAALARRDVARALIAWSGFRGKIPREPLREDPGTSRPDWLIRPEGNWILDEREPREK